MGNTSAAPLSNDDRRELLKSANVIVTKSFSIPPGLDYTMDEHFRGVDNVETGIHRELRSLGSDVKAMAKNGKKMVEKPAMRLEDVMRFMTRGELPLGGDLTLG